jgi:hypothetical protein
MAEEKVELVDNVDKGYWRRNDSSSEEEDESESEAGSLRQPNFNHLDKR